jgi:lipopolysaccharide transport system ATP-binding protein
LAFAVAAHLEPEILIVDEVLAVGDAQFQKKCLGKMEDVGKEGRTILFVSHSMGTIIQLCNKGIYLNNGSIVYQGSIDDAVTQYATAGSADNGYVDFPDKQTTSPVEFRRIAIVDVNELETSEIDIRYPFEIRLDYSINQPIRNAEISIRISTTDGRPVMTTAQSDCSPTKIDMRLPGLYQASIPIPSMFLVPGSYMLTIAAHEPNRHLFDSHENIISFRVLETGTKLSRYSDIHLMGVIIKDIVWNEKEKSSVGVLSSR